MSSISVILADAQYLIRFGLNQIVNSQQNIKVVGEATSEQDLFALLEAESVDVVVLDYNQPENFTTKTVKRLNENYPQTGMLVISADNERENIYEVLENGVTSFLTKSCDKDEILEGIFAAANNIIVIA